MAFLHRWGKKFLKFKWDLKGPRLAKTILKNNRNSGGLILPDFKTQYIQSYSNQNSVVLAQRQTQRPTEQRPERSPYACDLKIFHKDAKTTQWGKDRLHKRVPGRLDIQMQTNEARPFPYSIHKTENGLKIQMQFQSETEKQFLEENGSFMTLDLAAISWI